MSDVTRILGKIESGDPKAAEELLPLVYEELRKLAAAKMAQEKPGQTLQATALVHEAYIRLVDHERVQQWDSRGHFFAAAAEAMRRILVEAARGRNALKRGGGIPIGRLFDGEVAAPPADDMLLDLDGALTKLEAIDPLSAQLVKLRVFGGLPLSDVARVVCMTESTAKRSWLFARAWLRRAIAQDDDT
jgi:RNA polymerase sigma factor (TIGR02999 family)